MSGQANSSNTTIYIYIYYIYIYIYICIEYMYVYVWVFYGFSPRQGTWVLGGGLCCLGLRCNFDALALEAWQPFRLPLNQRERFQRASAVEMGDRPFLFFWICGKKKHKFYWCWLSYLTIDMFRVTLGLQIDPTFGCPEKLPEKALDFLSLKKSDPTHGAWCPLSSLPIKLRAFPFCKLRCYPWDLWEIG